MAQAVADPITRTPRPSYGRPAQVVATLSAREWVRFLRQKNRVFGAIGQPAVFWLLFGAGLGPTFRLPGTEATGLSYREYFFSGTVMLILLFTAIFTTISVIEDRREGFLQSVLVAPVSRWLMVLGKLVGGGALALAQGLIFLAFGVTIGIAFTPLSVLLAVVFLAICALALTALGFVFAWGTDSTQGYHAVMSVVLFPMWLLSGAFFPAEKGWLAWVLAMNPLTYGVAGLRRLLYLGVDNPPLPPGLPSMATCWGVTLLFAAVTFALSVYVAGRPSRGDLV